MDRIGIRQLRNDVSRIVRRARSGERMVITVGGVPAAEIGPLASERVMTLDDLIAAGKVIAPRRNGAHRPAPEPIDLEPGVTTERIVRELRED